MIACVSKHTCCCMIPMTTSVVGKRIRENKCIIGERWSLRNGASSKSSMTSSAGSDLRCGHEVGCSNLIALYNGIEAESDTTYYNEEHGSKHQYLFDLRGA